MYCQRSNAHPSIRWCLWHTESCVTPHAVSLPCWCSHWLVNQERHQTCMWHRCCVGQAVLSCLCCHACNCVTVRLAGSAKHHNQSLVTHVCYHWGTQRLHALSSLSPPPTPPPPPPPYWHALPILSHYLLCICSPSYRMDGSCPGMVSTPCAGPLVPSAGPCWKSRRTASW